MSRLETGPVRVEGDWAGVFIRGDQAAYIASEVGTLMEAYIDSESQTNLNKMEVSLLLQAVRGVIDTLKSCVEPCEAQGIAQRDLTAAERGAIIELNLPNRRGA